MRVGEREGPVAAAALAEGLVGILDVGNRGEGLAKTFESRR